MGRALYGSLTPLCYPSPVRKTLKICVNIFVGWMFIVVAFGGAKLLLTGPPKAWLFLGPLIIGGTYLLGGLLWMLNVPPAGSDDHID